MQPSRVCEAEVKQAGSPSCPPSAPPQDPPRTRVLSAYEAFEAALAAHGVVRGETGTPTALLDRAVSEGFPASDALLLTELFSAARYGDQPVTEADVAAAERALSSVLAAS